MANLMNILLADGRRLEERRAAPPATQPASRADQIIAEGDRRRHAYRAMNPDADTAMVFGAQIGYLHGEIRRLCHELEALDATRDPDLQYDMVECHELGYDVLVGFDHERGDAEPGSQYEHDALEVLEVWHNGADIAAVMMERVIDQLQDAVLAKIDAQQE